MKSWVLYGVNDIRFEERPVPAPGKGEVLVKVGAAGICGSDIPRIYETGAHRHPLIPGHEFAGIVEETGADTDAAWAGKRVGVFPLIPCKKCPECLQKRYEMCRSYDYLGSRRDGGFAEYVCVPEWNLLPLPDEVSLQAAAMLEPMAVAVHAMRRGAPEVGERIMVCGLGTIGLLLSMFLLDAGMKAEDLYVIGNKQLQKKQALALGIPEENYCNSRETDAREWAGGIGADLYFECVGRAETAALGLHAAAAGGRVVMMGNPHSDMSFSREDYWKILRKQLKVTGTWNSTYGPDEADDWSYVLERLKSGAVDPESLISHRFGLNELEKGLHIMRDRTEEYCKIMITEE